MVTLGDARAPVTAADLESVPREAWALRDAARRGDDPRHIVNPPTTDRGQSFEAIARSAFESRARNKRISERHAVMSLQRLERHVFPTLGDRPIAEISRTEFLQCYAAIPPGAGANRVLTAMQAVGSWAFATG